MTSAELEDGRLRAKSIPFFSKGSFRRLAFIRLVVARLADRMEVRRRTLAEIAPSLGCERVASTRLPREGGACNEELVDVILEVSTKSVSSST